jgi:hypothetical protein
VQQSTQSSLDIKVLGLVALGVALGLALGLLLGRLVWSGNTTLADLPMEDKEEYIVLVGSAYVLDEDLEKAQARLVKLEAPNIELWVVDLTERYIAEGRDEADIVALAALSHGLGVDTPQMVAYLASPTPRPTNTPLPTDTPLPTATPTVTSIPPTATPVPPTATPLPTDTPLPEPTDTPVPATETPQPTATATLPPRPTNTPPPPPPPTNTPKPAGPKWTWNAWLVGPGQDAQRCDAGNLQIRATVVDANGNQLSGVWIHDYYSGENRVTGHKGDDPFWGPGEAEFSYWGGGGGKLCITSGEGGPCESEYTRDMPCSNTPPVEDLFAAGYCDCCEAGATLERCRERINEGTCFKTGNAHYSWRVVFTRAN